MKQFYHFYVEVNNVENTHLAVDMDEIKKIDEHWTKILEEAKVELPQDYIDALTDQIYKQLF